MTVTKRLRYEILRRDGYACRYCGAKAPEATLTAAGSGRRRRRCAPTPGTIREAQQRAERMP